MGKIKESRFRLHSSSINKSHSRSKINVVEFEAKSSETLAPLPALEDNIFSGIDIDINDVAKSLKKSVDTCSVSGKSHREVKNDEQHLPKKEKIRRRHERFMQKLDVYYAKNKKSKKKKTKMLGGDMEPLIDALPSIPPEQPDSHSAKAFKTTTARPSLKVKKRLKEHKKDVKHFQRVLNDTVFRRNPAAAITQFLKQKVAEMRPDLQFQ